MLNASLIILLVAIFVGLIFVLKRILTQNVISATQHIEEMSREYLKKEEELNKQLQEAKQKCQEMLSKAQEEAAALKEQAIKQAETEKDQIIASARTQSEDIIQQAEKSRHSLLAELEEKINKEAINKACELIQHTLPDEFRFDAHLRWVEELLDKGFHQLERLNVPEEIREVKVSTAFVLTEQQHKILLKKVRDIIGKDVPIKEEVEPKVVAGIIIYIGSLVLDGSLRNKIKEIAAHQ